MKIIDLGVTGEPAPTDAEGWEVIGLAELWQEVIKVFAPGSCPHDIQIKALRDANLLQSRRNVIVSGPTNSGKSLLGYLAILQGLKDGRRALLLEPFRALAQEKYDELKSKMPAISKLIGKQPGVEITTGDYRLSGETLLSPPSAHGDIIIATPERIDAIMRDPDYDEWVSSFGVVCVDEAHLLGDKHRGAALESVITRLLGQKAPPRIILLSATLGGYETVQKWLQPCDVVRSEIRRPPLNKKIFKLEEEDIANDVVIDWIGGALNDTGTAVLMFVYRTQDAARLAQIISDKFGPGVALPYHSKLSAAMKAEARKAYDAGAARCLVSTTALGAGVNLPATHVVVRDLTFMGQGPLPLGDIIQMMGRAGRGNKSGEAVAILKPKDDWEEMELFDQLNVPQLPELKSVLLDSGSGTSQKRNGNNQSVQEQAAKMVLGELVRRDGTPIDQIEMFFSRSLGGKEIVGYIPNVLRWLSDNQNLLAWEDAAKGWVATSLGKAVARSGIPLRVGAGIGSLIRDVLSCDEEDRLLSKWSKLDSLIVLELVCPRERGIKRYSQQLPEQIEDWIERNSNKSILFTEWIRGREENSRAEEVIGSLGICLEGKGGQATRYAYLAVLRAIIMTRLGQGGRCQDEERRWSITGLEGVEERWRDHLLWLLAGLNEIMDIRCFYHHLKEACSADQERISRLKKQIASIRQGAFDLLGSLRFCSPLGPLLRDMSDARTGVGERTKDKLESLGILSLADILNTSDETMLKAGIARKYITKLKSYATRRMN